MRLRSLTVLLTFGWTAVVQAQPAGVDAEPPGQYTARRPDPAAIERQLLGDRSRAEPIPPLDSRTGDVLALAETDKLWPEGFQLSRRRGRLRPSGDGWEFVFAAGEEMTDPPIKLLPNSKLQQMASYLASADRVEFSVTGRVTEYRGVNHLLVREVAVLTSRQAPPEPPASPPQPPDTEGSEVEEPTGTQSIVDQLRAGAQAARPLGAAMESRGGRDAAPGAADRPSARRPGEVTELRPEETELQRRVGRLVREREGWTFAFESDSEVPEEPPVRLLPNLALQSMETATAGGTRSLVFVVSGEITQFQGQNFMLVQRFSIRPADGNLR